MKVVLDTNCFISSIGKRSPYRNVFDHFLLGSYTLCVSTDILLEYEEIFTAKWGPAVTQNLLARMVRAKNIEAVQVYYNFRSVKMDADDNKFADVFLAANADILVSNDKHLLSLNSSNFPTFNVMSLQDFCTLTQNL